MHINEIVLTRIDGQLCECIVIEMHREDVKLKFGDIIVTKYYWEIAKPKHE